MPKETKEGEIVKQMTTKEITVFFIVLISGIFIIGTVATSIFLKINTPEKMLAEINQYNQQWHPRNVLSVPESQKLDCLEWALGKDWDKIQWDNRADVFRDLHSELNVKDFSDSTPIFLFWERVSDAYLEAKS